jgi:hypothetical protein
MVAGGPMEKRYAFNSRVAIAIVAGGMQSVKGQARINKDRPAGLRPTQAWRPANKEARTDTHGRRFDCKTTMPPVALSHLAAANPGRCR